MLFDELTVAENIFIGHAPRTRLGLIDWPMSCRQRAAEILTRIDAQIDPGVVLKDLGIASKHLVAIARALSVDARVVIMDEPTASLSQTEIEEIYALVERLKAEGRAVLFISHKFDEVFRIADRYTVFRDGQHVGSGMITDVGENDLVRMMVGRSVDQIFPKSEHEIGDTILKVRGYCHPTEFDGISFELRRGEIVGFYGLVGAGRSELMQAIFGITRPSEGAIEIDGQPVRIQSPSDAINAWDRLRARRPGAAGHRDRPADLPECHPAVPWQRTSRSGFLQLAEEFALAREYTERLDLRAASLDQDVGNLSGGNQQKVVIAKWLATKPRVIILDEPTKGIDIGSKAAVHAFMSQLAADGLAVIMVSSEIPEVLGMSDRVIVMREGLITAELAGDEV